MTAAPILTRALRYGLILTIAIAAVGSVIGFIVAGVPGLVSALIGAGLTAVFMAFTALSLLLAGRVARQDAAPTLYFGIVLGVWLLKFVVFIVILVLLRGQPFLEPLVFFFAMLAAVIGSLVVDVLAFLRARVPYTDSVLPGSPPEE